MGAAPATRNAPADKKKKKKMVRFTQEEVDDILAYKPTPSREAPQFPNLPQYMQFFATAPFLGLQIKSQRRATHPFDFDDEPLEW